MAIMPHEVLIKSVVARFSLLPVITVAEDAVVDPERFMQDMKNLGATVHFDREINQYKVSPPQAEPGNSEE